MWREFKYTYLWAWKEDRKQLIKTVLGLISILGMIGFLIYHTATAIPQPGTIHEAPLLSEVAK